MEYGGKDFGEFFRDTFGGKYSHEEYTQRAIIASAMLSNMESHEEVESLLWEDYPTIIAMALDKYASLGKDAQFCQAMENILPECVKIYKS